MLLAAAVTLAVGVPAYAEGLIVSAQPPGLAGPQVEADRLSPALRRSPAAMATVPTRYVVQRGDTLSGIAARFGVDAATLAARNGIANPDRIAAGQTLMIDRAATASPSLPPDGPLTRLQFWPWPPTPGQTLVVWLQARAPIDLEVQAAGQLYPVVVSGHRGWVLLPIPVLTDVAVLPVTVRAGDVEIQLHVPLQTAQYEVDRIPASASDPILSQADKVRAELVRMAALFSGHSAGAWRPDSRFRLPLDGQFARTSPFGSRRIYGGSSAISVHLGEDYSAPPGTPVWAPAAGVVVLAEALFVRGNAVVLDHGQGVFTGYWHLESLSVREGERVNVGQLLGYVGSTGLSTGAHLHWELRVHGAAVNPLQWVEE